ncbi:MAG: S41 family peptidase [Pseudomonadota bacterium]
MLRATRWFVLILVAIALVACTQRQDETRGSAAKESGEAVSISVADEGQGIASQGIGPPLTIKVPAQVRLVSAGEAVAEPEGEGEGEGEGEEDEAAKYERYWNEIEFGWEQFDEVMDLIKSEYIEKEIDTQRAYVSAANFALAMVEPSYEVVPAAYHRAHKDDPDLVIEGGDREELILKRRDELRKQQRELLKDWDKVSFDRPELKRIIQFAAERARKMEKPVAEDRLLISAAQGFLYALDPHSSLVSERAWDDSTQQTRDSSFDGIGALLTQRWEPTSSLKNRLRGKTRRLEDNDVFILVELAEEDKFTRKTYVESPIQGQPAEKAGLWAGDEIVAVDGKSVEGVLLTKVVNQIRGPRGTQVHLSVRREGEPAPRDIVITRARIRVTNVEGRILEHHPGIGYVKLTGFIESSYDELKEEIDRLHEEAGSDGLRGLVFDLRMNSGGLLQQAVQISDLFLKTGKIVTVKNRKRGLFAFMGAEEIYRAAEDGTIDLPMVVLVNDGSASASEIVASALQDNGRGLVIGLRTFGKASVQTLLSPRAGQGYYVKLTVARYYSPSDRTIQVVGVHPDVEVAPEFGGKTPIGFREEDLSNHLPPIEAEFESPNQGVLTQLSGCVQTMGTADSIAASNPHPQVKLDYQLYTGADYLECFIEEVSGDEGRHPVSNRGMEDLQSSASAQ